MRFNPLIMFLVAMSCTTCAGSVHGVELAAQPITSGLDRPIAVVAAPGDNERLFVLEQNRGTVRILHSNGAGGFDLMDEPFLDLAAIDRPPRPGGETGLLGIAFRPDYQDSGVFFLRYIDKQLNDYLLRCTVSDDPNVANTEVREILVEKQPQGNHNGGWVAFGPDGYLYTSYGDGGSRNDGLDNNKPDDEDGHGTIGNGQATANVLGTLVRIDVGSNYGGPGQEPYGIPADNPELIGRDHFGQPAAARPEIFHYGLRNAWRCSFDRETGDLWMGDVGQVTIEEINFAAANAKGLNFGWRIKEGLHHFDDHNHLSPTDSSLVDPVLSLGRDLARSITGGYVYRGTAIPELRGTYVFADYPLRRIYTFDSADGKTANNFLDRTSQMGHFKVSSFGEDLAGEIYFCELTEGTIYRLVEASMLRIPPSITSRPSSKLTVGESYAYQVTATGTGTIHYTLEQAPAGMTVHPTTGVITWNPTASDSGTTTVIVKATNHTDVVAQQSFTIDVATMRPADTITGTLSPGLQVAGYKGRWSSLEEIHGQPAASSETHSHPEISMRPQDKNFALRFDGLVAVPESGMWSLMLNGRFGGGSLMHWSFDRDDATDDSGQDRHGSLSGGTWLPGLAGRAVAFNGSADQGIENRDLAKQLNGRTELTVAMWIQSAAINSDHGFFIGKEPDGDDDTLSMRYDKEGSAGGQTNVIKVGLTTTTGQYQLETAANTQTTAWQHVVWTWKSGERMQVYLDGQLNTPSSAPAGQFDGEIIGVDRILVGRGSKDQTSSWNGLIDDVRVYPYAVAADEAIELMAGRHPSDRGAAQAQLAIGDRVVVDTTHHNSGQIALAAGLHRVSVAVMQHTVDESFGVLWSGPASDTATPVPTEVWQRYEQGFGLEPSVRPQAYLNLPKTVDGGIPTLLSKTGVFANLRTRTPAPGVIPYQINTPAWTDGTSTRYWIALPESTVIDYSRDGNWTFPAGTVLVQHLSMGEREVPVETRLLVLADDSRYGVTYSWNSAGTEGTRLDTGSGGLIELGDGKRHGWYYPSPADCIVCHTDVAGGVLGVRTHQLNRELTYPSTGRSDNQLRTWSHLGFFGDPLPAEEFTQALALAAIDDETRSLEERALSFLDSNCSGCHQPNGPVPAAFDLRFGTPLTERGIINGAVNIPLGGDGSVLLRPGDVKRSMLHYRAHALDDGVRMPFNKRLKRDEESLQVLAEWIESMAEK